MKLAVIYSILALIGTSANRRIGGIIGLVLECVAKSKPSFAIDARRNLAYLPFYWRYIMTTICSGPETLFKRASL